MIIQFDINHQHLVIQSGYYIVSNSENYITAKFTFSDDWENLEKTAVFRRSGDGESTAISVKLDNNSCIIPESKIKYPGMKVYVYGSDGSTVIHTNAELIKVVKCGLEDTDDIGSGSSHDDAGVPIIVIDDFLSPLSDNPVSNKTLYNNFKTVADNYATKAEIASKAEKTHNHSVSEITDFPTEFEPTSHNHSVSDITDFPTTFEPKSHTHTASEITDLEIPEIPASVGTAVQSVKIGKNGEELKDGTSVTLPEYPIIPDWVGDTKPIYTASEVGALAADGTAAKATEDADGNNIASTYATKTEVAEKADKSVVDTHTADKSNPHSVTKEQVGLGNVDNTSDANKPVSTATQTALDTKADKSEIIPNDNVKVTGKLIDKIGWYRLASFKGTGNASTQGSSCNSCEIILQRSFGTHANEYHHIYFTGIYQARQFNSISNKSNSYLFDKIRYVEVKDENNILTSYIDIYNYINSNNNFHYKILNSANSINLSWKPCFEYVGTDDISNQVVYTIPANSELAQKPVTLWSGNRNVSDSITDININTDISSTSCPYKSLQIIASAVNGEYVYTQPVQVLDINQIIANGCAEYYLYNGYALNVSKSATNETSLTFDVTNKPDNTYDICILEIRGVM